MTVCNVCGTSLGQPIYRSGGGVSLTTINTLLDGETEVFFCTGCGHVQTSELPDLARFYAEDYEINIEDDEDDQLYAVIDGKEVYRSQHQAAVLAEKLDLSGGTRVLDYGCAKAATLRQLKQRVPDIESHLFDVTDKYTGFWERFPEPKQFAAFTPDPAWQGRMDVVLSFYALEHIPDLAGILANIHGLLRPGGQFYFLVPNMYANVADFIVADHVNHFSRSSLTVMLRRAGFERIEIDDTAHAAAFVVTARAGQADADYTQAPDDGLRDAAGKMAEIWTDMGRRIRAFEAGLDPDLPRFIYGAGVYGNFILSRLTHPDRVAGFLDRNRHLAGRVINGVTVRHPDAVADRDAAVLVGLNPAHARASIADVAALDGTGKTFFYLG